MALTPIWCCLTQRYVTRATNGEDEVVAVVCPELEFPADTCRVKSSAMRSGFLVDLVRGDDGPAMAGPQRGSRCRLV